MCNICVRTATTETGFTNTKLYITRLFKHIYYYYYIVIYLMFPYLFILFELVLFFVFIYVVCRNLAMHVF